MRLRLFGWTIEVWVEAFCECIIWRPYCVAHAYSEDWSNYLGWQRGGWVGWLILEVAWLAAHNDWVDEKRRQYQARQKAKGR